jgi:hypothetical protein
VNVEGSCKTSAGGECSDWAGEETLNNVFRNGTTEINEALLRSVNARMHNREPLKGIQYGFT